MISDKWALEVVGVTRDFGGLRAVNGVSLAVAAGERLALIGPNGAGKSTLFNLIAGALPLTAGRVLLNGVNMTGAPVAARTKAGIGRTFQRNNLFLGMTALENVRLAVQQQMGIARQWWRPAAQFEAVVAKSTDLLAQVGLGAETVRPVGQLAYGQQRALELALALAVEPSVLLLDEPTAGMSGAETAVLVDLIATLPRTLTVLIVEHDMDVIFSLADRIAVLHHGQLIASGTPEAVRQDALVQEIYLGKE